MTSLRTFTNALEKATGFSFVSAITCVPLRIHAYKEFVFILKGIGSCAAVYQKSYKEKVTTEEEKEEVIERLTEDFIAYVLKELLKT